MRLPPLLRRGRKSGSARFVHLQEKLDAQSKELSGFTTHINSDVSRPGGFCSEGQDRVDHWSRPVGCPCSQHPQGQEAICREDLQAVGPPPT